MVVGADGSQSCVRSHVLNSPLAETKERDVTLNYLIPMEAVREHEELIPLTHTPGVSPGLVFGILSYGRALNTVLHPVVDMDE